jgi:hypothetical protein
VPSILTKFEQQGYKKTMKKNRKKQKMKKWATLNPNLHFDSSNRGLYFKLLFWVWINWFSFQIDAM